jgi:hypothetical protein
MACEKQRVIALQEYQMLRVRSVDLTPAAHPFTRQVQPQTSPQACGTAMRFTRAFQKRTFVSLLNFGVSHLVEGLMRSSFHQMT